MNNIYIYISNRKTQQHGNTHNTTQHNTQHNNQNRTMITSGNGSYAFTTMYVYGTRVYSAAEVDAAIQQLAAKNNDFATMLHEVRVNMQDIQTMYASASEPISSSEYWNNVAISATTSMASMAASSIPEPICEEVASTLTTSNSGNSGIRLSVHENDPADPEPTPAPDSPRSISSSAGGSLYGGDGCARGRAVGKRNQDMYLPDGVKLSHVAGTEDEPSEWIARFDKASNTIIREPDNELKTEKVYETLKHFAREHDYATYGDKCSYIETVNVWKNQLFTFYDTVKCKWEPLSELR